MRHGDRRGKEEFHRQAAENPLRDDGPERDPAQKPDPPPRLAPGEPHREDDRQDPDGRRDHAVAVLVTDAADHRRHQAAVGERPIGHRQPRLGGGHETTGEDQAERGYGRQNREPVKGHAPGPSAAGRRRG